MSGFERVGGHKLVAEQLPQQDRRYTRISVTGIVEDYVRELDTGAFGRLAAALQRATPEQRQTIRAGLELLRELLQ